MSGPQTILTVVQVRPDAQVLGLGDLEPQLPPGGEEVVGLVTATGLSDLSIDGISGF